MIYCAFPPGKNPFAVEINNNNNNTNNNNNEDEPEDFIWQQDGVPPHFHRNVRRWLNDVLLHRWIGWIMGT
jgi:hypothetical protein